MLCVHLASWFYVKDYVPLNSFHGRLGQINYETCYDDEKCVEFYLTLIVSMASSADEIKSFLKEIEFQNLDESHIDAT